MSAIVFDDYVLMNKFDADYGLNTYIEDKRLSGSKPGFGVGRSYCKKGSHQRLNRIVSAGEWSKVQSKIAIRHYLPFAVGFEAPPLQTFFQRKGFLHLCKQK
jgi:hypothetical protein